MPEIHTLDYLYARWQSVRNEAPSVERERAGHLLETAANQYLAMRLAEPRPRVDHKGQRIVYTFEGVQAEIAAAAERMEELGLAEGYGDPSGTPREQADAIAAWELAQHHFDLWDDHGRKPNGIDPTPPKPKRRFDKKRNTAAARAAALSALGRK